MNTRKPTAEEIQAMCEEAMEDKAVTNISNWKDLHCLHDMSQYVQKGFEAIEADKEAIQHLKQCVRSLGVPFSAKNRNKSKKVLRPFKRKLRILTDLEKRTLHAAEHGGIMYIALAGVLSGCEDSDVVRDLEKSGLIEMEWTNPYTQSYGIYWLTPKGKKILESQPDEHQSKAVGKCLSV